ncbi:phenylpropionate dioxygenase-like ring-hydroxylating dioxygenase large terminal subunit [Pigmentiphaga kullae]|uniref:Phenylpropionate dioxygenase-like ring-hydroxylating dioxygenase large terminal subunit n=2 Tax=Pigmentiphaga kullae TaxID=151784 RepID=A0A4V2F3P9_9BURK|nr:phenylpropionate dioxygenase-like ring-hydroxylating dioxygenase large terminal subunit [Pigmentiphaga kullae]
MMADVRCVDVAAGTADRRMFVDDDLFAREVRQIFGRAWLLVGHESQVPDPEDFIQSKMGTDSVIVTRTRQDKIVVLLNSCRHRGMKVCRVDEGKARAFTCPYHGWTYSTDEERVSRPGELAGVPGFDVHYEGRLDKAEWGLKAARVRVYKGTIWATWDEHAPSLEAYLGGMLKWLDSALDHRNGDSGGSTLLVGVQKFRVRCNWKFPATNFVGDASHAVTHNSANMIKLNPSGKDGRRDERASGHAAFGWPDLGHGGLGFLPRPEEEFPRPDTFQQFPAASNYLRDMAREHLRKRAGGIHYQGKGTIFPNMSFHEDQPRTLVVHHPVSATETEMWRYYLIDADAPDEVKDIFRHYYMTYSGPGGMTEQDDIENWESATRQSLGGMGRDLPFNYAQGLGESEPCDLMPGAVWCGRTITEQNQLIWLKRWQEFMEGRSWDQLMHRVEVEDDAAFPLKRHAAGAK